MSDLNFLIQQKVRAEIEIDENDFIEIEGIVTSITINDFYFHEKGEPIYIQVSINPTEELPDGVDLESLIDIPLNKIFKA